MDLFATFLDLAGLEVPANRHLDSVSLKGVLLNNTEDYDRPVFFYRGNLLYAVRKGPYKMHLWTWTTPDEELRNVGHVPPCPRSCGDFSFDHPFFPKQGIDHCPDMAIPEVTTTTQVSHEKKPVLFHLERDPGERYNHGGEEKTAFHVVRCLTFPSVLGVGLAGTQSGRTPASTGTTCRS